MRTTNSGRNMVEEAFGRRAESGHETLRCVGRHGTEVLFRVSVGSVNGVLRDAGNDDHRDISVHRLQRHPYD